MVLDLRTGRSSHPALLMTVITYRPRLICVAAQSNCSAQLAQVDSCSALQLGSVGLGAHSVCVCGMPRFDVQHAGARRGKTWPRDRCHQHATSRGQTFLTPAHTLFRWSLRLCSDAPALLSLLGGGVDVSGAGFGLSSRRCVFGCQGWGFECTVRFCRKPTLSTEPPAAAA